MSKKTTVHENLEENYANKLYIDISNVLNEKRKQAYIAVSQSMLQAYWQIGKIIIEEEQNGELRSEHGKNVLQKLSDKLTAEFGKGFSVRTLQQMKKFYTLFPIANALRSQLTWTHYRSLLKVSNESKVLSIDNTGFASIGMFFLMISVLIVTFIATVHFVG